MRFAAIGCCFLFVSNVSAGVIVDGSFESGSGSFPFAFPTVYGDWGGDPRTHTNAEQGIAPLAGDKMLRFDATGLLDRLEDFSSADIWQLVDLSPLATGLQQGSATAELSAAFNRVAGDAETDNVFFIEIHAIKGVPGSFPDQVNFGQQLAIASARIVSDADPSSWETVTTKFIVPPSTDFLAVRIAALENIANDAVLPELDGHYVDAVALNVNAVPEPSYVAVLGFATIGFLGRRPRKQANGTNGSLPAQGSARVSSR